MRRLLTAIFAIMLLASAASAQSNSRGVTTWHADENFFLQLNASYGICPAGSYISAITFGQVPSCTAIPAFGGALAANLNFNGQLGTNLACPTTNAEAFVTGCNIALGSVNDIGGANNTWVGVGALSAVTGGARNTAFGTNALNLNTNGSNNIGIGYGALNTNTTGQDNTAIGVYALRNFTDTSNNLDYNTAVGMDAGYYLTTGTNNVFLGFLGNITTGSHNILIGNSLANTTATSSYQFDIGDTIYGPLVGSGLTAPITIVYGISQTPQTPAPAAAVTFNWAASNNFIPTILTVNTTVTFTHVTTGQHITVIFQQAAGGGPLTVTWPTVRWLGGGAPTMTATTSAKDRYDFYYDGTDILGVAIQGF